MFLSSFCPKPLIGVLVAFLLLWVPCTFSFISLFIAFIFSSICDHTQPFLWASWLPVFWTVHLIGWLSLRHLVVFFLELWSVFSFGPFFLSWCTCYIKGWNLRCSPGWGNPSHCVVKLYVGEGQRWNSATCSAHCNFQSLFLLPTSKLGHSGADSPGRWVCVYSRTLWVSPMNSPMRFLNPHRFFQSEVLRLYFPTLGPWVAQSVSLPSCSSWFISTQMWDRPLLQLPLTCSSSHSLATSPLCPGCLAPPLLLVWMYVSSLTPWLLDFHTVRFPGSSGWFLFLNLLFFFWLCEEA